MSERRKAGLLNLALEGAARSAAEQKIAWFAQCLAAGYLATDDAVVDREMFYVEAFAQVEMPHIRVLTYLANGHATHDQPPTTDDLSNVFAATLCPVIRPILATLERVGLVVKHPVTGLTGSIPQHETGVPHVWEISSFGKYRLARIEGKPARQQPPNNAGAPTVQ